MNEHQTGQVAASAADIYEQFFVPALFAEWPVYVLQAADVQAGHDVLDVACGTGVLARTAVSQVGNRGSVTGVDINEGMLAVARRLAPAVRWQSGPAEALPFEDGRFDRVVSQFGLMFFEDKPQAVTEMNRVLRDGGKTAVAVWGSLDTTPGYVAVVDMLSELFGAEAAQSIEMPYSLGDKDELTAIFAQAGIDNIAIETVWGKVRFPSVEAWIYTDIKGWTLADKINDAEYEALKQVAPQKLSRFVLPDGSVAFDTAAHIVTFEKHE